MLRSFSIAACAAVLINCAAASQAAALCSKPAPLDPENPRDKAVAERFAGVCGHLGREFDLDFGEDTFTYSCGVRHDNGLLSNGSPADVWRETQEQRAKLAEALGPFARSFETDSSLIGLYGGRYGWGHILLLLTDDQGELRTVLATRPELARPLTVKSLEAASRLVSMMKVMEFMETFWFCKGEGYQAADAWVFPSVRKNCQPLERDVRVGFDGRIEFSPDRPTQGKVCGVVD